MSNKNSTWTHYLCILKWVVIRVSPGFSYQNNQNSILSSRQASPTGCIYVTCSAMIKKSQKDIKFFLSRSLSSILLYYNVEWLWSLMNETKRKDFVSGLIVLCVYLSYIGCYCNLGGNCLAQKYLWSICLNIAEFLFSKCKICQ